MNDYFMVGTDGALYDTRQPGWSGNPVRGNYSRHHARIETLADLKATLRAGAYAWPGGYPLYFITADGGALAFETVRAEFETIAAALRADDWRGGWRVVACDVNWESELWDDHTGQAIESAYNPVN